MELQRPSGDRVTTDAKDAVHLARLLQLDEFTAVAVPTGEQEAARDLVRAREDARGDLMRARHRWSKLLLRQGFVYSGGHAWTGAQDTWLRQVGRQLGSATQMTFESDYDAVLSVKARRDRLAAAMAQMAADCEFTPMVHRLGCLRGVGTLTVEVGDWERFTGKSIGSFIRLVPSHRWTLAGPAASARGDEGNRRLHHRWNTMRARHKKHTVANIAIARELAGWCWSLAVMESAIERSPNTVKAYAPT